MKLIYIAGPFTAPNTWEIEKNIRAAEELGALIVSFGAYPVIPHANTRFFSGLAPVELFYQGTMELMLRCNAVALLPRWQDSLGAVREYAMAERRKVPVFKPEKLIQIPGILPPEQSFLGQYLYPGLPEFCRGGT